LNIELFNLIDWNYLERLLRTAFKISDGNLWVRMLRNLFCSIRISIQNNIYPKAENWVCAVCVERGRAPVQLGFQYGVHARSQWHTKIIDFLQVLGKDVQCKNLVGIRALNGTVYAFHALYKWSTHRHGFPICIDRRL
jgi:hypothetical protein